MADKSFVSFLDFLFTLLFRLQFDCLRDLDLGHDRLSRLSVDFGLLNLHDFPLEVECDLLLALLLPLLLQSEPLEEIFLLAIGPQVN